MEYIKTRWQDGVNMIIDAERLNNMENGIEAACNAVLSVGEIAEKVSLLEQGMDSVVSLNTILQLRLEGAD